MYTRALVAAGLLLELGPIPDELAATFVTARAVDSKHRVDVEIRLDCSMKIPMSTAHHVDPDAICRHVPLAYHVPALV